MTDTFWHAVDIGTGEECDHKHHSKDHALRCARARFARPGTVRCIKANPGQSYKKVHRRLTRRGAIMEYSDDRTISENFRGGRT